MFKLKLTCSTCSAESELIIQDKTNVSFTAQCSFCASVMKKEKMSLESSIIQELNRIHEETKFRFHKSLQDDSKNIKVSSKNHDEESQKRTELIKKMFEKYKEYKTLEKVANEFGYTRERIRQYLVLGNKMGIIQYKPFNRENFKKITKKISKEDLLQLLDEYGAVRRISEKTGISIAHLNRLFSIYDLDVSELRKNYLKKAILSEYQGLVEELGGYHPSTYDLLSIKNGRNLWAKISRNWGTFRNFRQEYNIVLERKYRRKGEDIQSQFFAGDSSQN